MILVDHVTGSVTGFSVWYTQPKTLLKKPKLFEFDNKTIETTAAIGESNMLDAFIKVRDMRQKNLMIHDPVTCTHHLKL